MCLRKCEINKTATKRSFVGNIFEWERRINVCFILFVFSFAILWGPWNHVKHICSYERLPFTIAYFGTMSATLYFAIAVSSVFFKTLYFLNEFCRSEYGILDICSCLEPSSFNFTFTAALAYCNGSEKLLKFRYCEMF